jgi:hypothetical protein
MLPKDSQERRQNTQVIYSNVFTFILSGFLKNKTLFVENPLNVDKLNHANNKKYVYW